MTEQQWLSSADPAAMLSYLETGSVIESTSAGYQVAYGERLPCCTDRRLRLFACAAALQLGAESLEAYGDEGERLSDPLAVAAAWCQAPHIPEQRAALLREIFGNPFRPIRTKVGREYLTDEDWKEVEQWQKWLTTNVLGIAQGQYENGFDAMIILREALLDAGCDNEQILSHCLEPIHVKGCWLVDCLLGKS